MEMGSLKMEQGQDLGLGSSWIIQVGPESNEWVCEGHAEIGRRGDHMDMEADGPGGPGYLGPCM
jgi:hypothetical protein